MKKNIFNLVLVFGAFFLLTSFVSAVDFVSPEEGQIISGGLFIEWVNGSGASGLYLKYNEESCNASQGWKNVVDTTFEDIDEYVWDTHLLDDGTYCLGLAGSGEIPTDTGIVSGMFVIDNTAPVIEFGEMVRHVEEGEVFTFNATITDETNIEGYSVDFRLHIDGEPVCQTGSVDINFASSENLERLSGVGGTTAQNIINLRPFNSVDDLIHVSGIGETTLENIKNQGLVCISASNIVEVELGGDNDTFVEVIKEQLYEKEGRYEIVITAWDEAGNKASKSYILVVTMENPDWVIFLRSDKPNLISIPVMPQDTAVESVFSGMEYSVNVIYNYDKALSQDGWVFANPLEGQWSNNGLYEIVPGRGYIVYMAEDEILYGKGVPTEIPSLEIEISPGWNLLGHRGEEETSVVESLSSLDLPSSYRWNEIWTRTKDYALERVTGYFDRERGNYNTKPQEGYWVSIVHEDQPIYM